MSYTYSFHSYDYRDYASETHENIMTFQVPCLRSEDALRFWPHHIEVSIDLSDLPEDQEQWAMLLALFDTKLRDF